MRWFKAQEPKIEFPPNPTPEPPKPLTEMERASDLAQDAGDILYACEKRLAPDSVLLAMCEEFENTYDPPANIWASGILSCLSWSDATTRKPTEMPYRDTKAITLIAIRKEKKRIALRIAKANLVAAQNAVKEAQS